MGLGVREVGGSDRRSAGHLLTCSGLDARDQSRGDAGCGDNTVGLPEVRRLHAWHRLPPARDATSIVPPKVAEPQSTSPVSTASPRRGLCAGRFLRRLSQSPTASLPRWTIFGSGGNTTCGSLSG